MINDIASIVDYHAHVYYEQPSMDQARKLLDAAVDSFGVQKGRMHEKLVGPHPMWSCELLATREQFHQLLPWLALNRNGLIIFAHPNTGDDLADHRDHGIWLGTGLELDLSIFT